MCLYKLEFFTKSDSDLDYEYESQTVEIKKNVKEKGHGICIPYIRISKRFLNR